ncbi:hypothetical protein [Aquisediminimonas profunda]|uniref:hypothetical protein n=1 Tax=Aquisediminimonas profunda TaxID=1550733 RepID=UPI001C631B29|nr:hypothetical protein [Aquisediminimonas profunda]
MKPIVYNSSRGWGIYGMLISLLFVAMFIWFFIHPHGRATALAPEGIIIFCFGILSSSAHFIRPARLAIAADGFSFHHPLWITNHKWSEIDDIWLLQRTYSPLLVWRLKVRPTKLAGSEAQNTNSYDGALPVMWRGKQTEIALRMIAALEADARASHSPA